MEIDSAIHERDEQWALTEQKRVSKRAREDLEFTDEVLKSRPRGVLDYAHADAITFYKVNTMHETDREELIKERVLEDSGAKATLERMAMDNRM